MWTWLKKLAGSKQTDPKTSTDVSPFGISVEVRTSKAESEPPLLHKAADDWDSLPSAEKIKRVPIKLLPFRDGQVVQTGSKSKKRFAVRLSKQKAGVFEFDEEAAITVFVVARGREAAFDMLAEQICGRHGYADDAKAMKGSCGRWYDGDIVQMEIVGIEKVE